MCGATHVLASVPVGTGAAAAGDVRHEWQPDADHPGARRHAGHVGGADRRAARGGGGRVHRLLSAVRGTGEGPGSRVWGAARVQGLGRGGGLVFRPLGCGVWAFKVWGVRLLGALRGPGG